MSATDDTRTAPSVDAERIAGAIARNSSDWGRDDIRTLTGAVASIADDTNAARHQGIDWSKAIGDIVDALGTLGDEVNSARCDALDAIVTITPLDDPIVEGDRAIVAWAFTAGGDTLPMVTTAANPAPQIQRYPALREVN